MRLDDFAFDLRRNVAPDNHLFVHSGFATVRPLPGRVVGVGELFSPPFALRGLGANAVFTVDGHRVADEADRGKGDCGLLFADGVWKPHEIVRQGTYHFVVDGRLISFHARATLTPLADAPGYAVRIDLRNRAERRMEFALAVELDPGAPAAVAANDWGYMPPEHGAPARAVASTPEHPRRWSNGTVVIELIQPAAALTLDPGAEGSLWFAVLAGGGDAPRRPEGGGPEAWAARARETWARRLDEASARLPVFESAVPGLENYARRGLLSGLVCLWDHPDFVRRPYLATSGLDGGAICAYLWDVTGYAPRSIAQWLGPRAADLARSLGDIGLDRYYAIAPGGGGVGCAYAYSAWSYLQLVWALALFEKPDPALYAHARRLLLAMEAQAKKIGGLVDFGGQHNLLEMRASGWEGATASPNAERATCFEQLAALADALGVDADDAAHWRAQAAAIRAEVRRVLWNKDRAWFDALHADGRREAVYSIQAYDAYRAGVCDGDMERALLSHLRDGVFLGGYGVSSVSAEDERHYELNDPDWSGGGAYTGEGPLLALTLWERNRPREAWDVLRRLLWMGGMLPYYPQEHYCDRPATPAHKRANVVAGLAAYEAAVYGPTGLAPAPDGTLTLHGRDWLPGGYSLRGFRFRGCELSIESDGTRRKVTVDGRVAGEGSVAETVVIRNGASS